MNVLKPHKQTTIFTLLGLRKSQRDIERITGIDRKTIRSYQRQFEASRSNSPGVATDSPECRRASNIPQQCAMNEYSGNAASLERLTCG